MKTHLDNLPSSCLEWSQWTDFGSCSRTCGSGASSRSRECLNEELRTSVAEALCIGAGTIATGKEEVACLVDYCADGGGGGEETTEENTETTTTTTTTAKADNGGGGGKYIFFLRYQLKKTTHWLSFAQANGVTGRNGSPLLTVQMRQTTRKSARGFARTVQGAPGMTWRSGLAGIVPIVCEQVVKNELKLLKA